MTNNIQKNNNYKTLFILIIAHFIAMNIAYHLLAAYFEFQEILRKPALEMLALYTKNQHIIQPTYYLFTLTGLSFFAISFYIHESLPLRTTLSRLAMAFGCLAGIFTSLGFIRWTFVIPKIARSYLANTNNLDLLNSLEADMSLIHSYSGVAIGENLAFLLQSLWLICLAIDLRTNQKGNLSVALPGVFIGIGVLLYSSEQFGGVFSVLGSISIGLQAAWLVWLISLAQGIRNLHKCGKFALSKTEVGAFLGIFTLLLAVI